MKTTEIIRDCLEKMEAIEYHENPRQAYMDFQDLNSTMLTNIYCLSRIRKSEAEMYLCYETVNHVLEEQEPYDAPYHSGLFDFQRTQMKRIAGELVIELERLYEVKAEE